MPSTSLPPTASVGTKRERRKEARPGELLEAALDLFVEKGFAATRVDEVAARAGVSKGTLFLYFPSKEELFKAVVRQNIAGRFVEWAQEVETFDGSAAELLRDCYLEWWERVGATKASGITKLIFSEGQNFPEIMAFYKQEVILPGQELVRRVIQRGIDRGEFRAVPIDCILHVVLAPMIFLMLWKHSMATCLPDGLDLTPEQFINAQIDNVLNGLLVRPDPSSPVPSPSHTSSAPPSRGS
ncbi:MAG: TetR family transcriptional regulator [Burkholderiales bacterium GWA2_64_37]|nr:MAG: TetR family transcriptional regulator [Burkholderiales bacterium GWA2_64_37]HCE94933.1 TetR family transcriptional regulator [Acidovorax sp.]